MVEPKLVESIGLGAPSLDPLDVIKIVKQDTESIDFLVVNAFGKSVSAISVNYHDDEGSIDCAAVSPVSAGAEIPYSAICVDGQTDVSIYVVVSGDETEDCNKCKAPSADSAVMVAHYFELSCVTECDENDSVGMVPTTSPTPAPQATLLDCYTGADDQSEGQGCPYSDMPIKVESMDGQKVQFTVANYWNGAGDNSIIDVRYNPFGGADSLDCFQIKLKNGEVKPQIFAAECSAEGVAEVEVFVTDVGLTGDAGMMDSACGTSKVNCAHLFVLPCKPEIVCETASPSASPVVSIPDGTPDTPAPVLDCADPVSLVNVVTGSNTNEPFPQGAVQVDGYDTETGEITFSVKQKWKQGQVSWISLVVDTDGDGIPETCEKENGFDVNEINEYTTMCDPEKGSVIVQLYLHDGQFKTSSELNPGTCDGWPTPKAGTLSNVVGYDLTFTCSCSRRLGVASAMKDSKYEAADEPSTDHDDMPYCVAEDFPCEGEEANMVYVCHYSVRKGYQTFCVPEADSDILRFYAHDYCGPCEGGQGVTWGEMEG